MSSNFVGGAMGSSQRDVVVRLIADTARFVDQMGIAGEAVEDMVRQITGLDEVLNKVRKTVGTTMLAMGAGIQAKLAIGTRAAARWEQAFADVAKTVEGTPQQLEKVDRSLRQMSTTMPIAAEGLASIAAVAGQLGIQVDSIDNFTKVAAQLGVATEMSSVQAIAGLSRVMKVMNEADETVENLASSLVHLGNVSNSTEGEILNFAQNIAGTANAMGFAAKEVLGIANAFASAGVNAEAGGTAVQKVMIGMNEAAVQGGRKLEVFTQLLGVTNDEFREMWTNNPAEVLTRFVEVLQTQGAGAVRILSRLDLDDQRLVRAFLNVANSSESLRESIQNSNDAFRDNTALSEEARKRFDTLNQSLTTLWNAIKQISVSMGRPFLEALTTMTQMLTKFLNLWNKLPDWFKSGIAVIMGAVGAIATLTGGFVLMSKTLGAAIAMWRTFRSALVQVPLTALIRGIRGLNVETEGLGVVARTAAEGFNFLGRILRDLLAIFRDVGKSMFMQTDIGRKLANLRNSLANFGNWAIPGDPFSVVPIPEERDMVNKGKSLMGSLVDGMKAAGRRMVDLFRSLMDSVTSLWRGELPRKMRDITAGAMAGAAATGAAGTAAVQGAGLGAGELLALGRGVEAGEQLGALTGTKESLQALVSAGLTPVQKAAEKASEAGSKLGERFVTMTSRASRTAQATQEVANSSDDVARAAGNASAGVGRAAGAFNILTAALIAGTIAYQAMKKRDEELRESLESTEETARRVGEAIGISFDDAAIQRPSAAANRPRFEQEQFLKDNEKAIKQLKTLGEQAQDPALTNILVRLQMENPNMPMDEALLYIQDLARAVFGEDYQFNVDGGQLADLQFRLDALRRSLENLPGTREGQGIGGKAVGFFSEAFRGLTPLRDMGGEQLAALQGEAGTIIELMKGEESQRAEAMARLVEAGKTLTREQYRELTAAIEDQSEGLFDVTTSMWEGHAETFNEFIDNLGGTMGEQFLASIPEEIRGDVDALIELAQQRREEEAKTTQVLEEQSEFYQLMGEEYFNLTGQEQKRFMQWRVFQARQQVGAEKVAAILRSQLETMREEGGETAVTQEQYQNIAQELEKIERELNKVTLRELDAEANAMSAGKAVEFWREKLKELGSQAVDSAADLELLEQAEQKLAEAIERRQTEFLQAVETHKRLVKELEQVQERHAERVADLNEQRAESIEDASESYQERLADINEAEKESAENTKESLNTIFDAFRRFQGRMDTMSTRGVALNIEEQNKQLQQFRTDLAKLKDMGLSTEFIEQSGLSDPQNWRQVGRMMRDAMADPSLIERVNQAWATRGEISEALMPETEDFQESKEKFEEQRRDAKESYDERMADIAESHREGMERLNEETAQATERINEQIAEIGKNTATSLAEALEYASEFGTDRMKEMAAAIQADMKTTADKTTQDFDRMGTAIEGVGETGKTAASEIQQAFGNMVEEVKSYFMGEQGLVATVKGASDDLLTIGQEFAEQYSQTGMWAITAPGTFTPAQNPLAVAQAITALSQFDARIGDYLKSQSPNTVSQVVTAAMQYGLSKSDIESVLTPAGVAMPFAKGGIATQEMIGRIAEAGSEAIIPLNARGAHFFAEAMSKAMPRMFTQQDSGMSRDVRALVDTIRSSGLNSQQTTFRVDKVEASDPNEMARKLKQRERLSRLTTRTRGAVAQ